MGTPDVAPAAAVGDVAELLDVDVQQRTRGVVLVAADRFAGAAEVAGDHTGVTLEFVSTDRLTLPDGRVAGEKLLARPAAGRPDALFGANDLVALGLLQAITGTRALRVPDDIALIGYDDIAFAAGAAVPLTSIAKA